MSEEEKARISRETYDVAKYLLREYNGTGKTFVLQNWEGDNMMGTNFCRVGKDGYLYDTRTDGSFEDATAETDAKVKRSLQGLVDWFNARQAGVDKAVKELGKFTDVTVKHALEINFIYVEGVDHAPYPYPDSPILLDTVVPYTDCDLYSYSKPISMARGTAWRVVQCARDKRPKSCSANTVRRNTYIPMKNGTLL